MPGGNCRLSLRERAFVGYSADALSRSERRPCWENRIPAARIDVLAGVSQMMPTRTVAKLVSFGVVIIYGSTLQLGLSAAEPVSPALVKETVDAVGGEAKLLRLFRMKELLALGADPEKKGSPRTTVVEPPEHWWQGTKDRV